MTSLLDFNYLILLRLVAAVLCGGIIGWERGGTNHEAGLRTHIIVCLGAASIMVVSQCLVEQYKINQEIMRMSAQIVSGIGFLGAGSIIVDGNRIRGITTAAGLWTTACVGIAIGAGYYVIGFVVVFLMLFTMLGLRSVTLRLRRKSATYTVKVELSDKESLKYVMNEMLELNVAIHSMKKYYDENDHTEVAFLEIILPENLTIDGVICKLSTVGGISQLKPV